MAEFTEIEAVLLLRIATGISNVEFRDGQWDAIDALVNRKAQMLVVQRTGWGKSSVYFIATKALRDQGRGPTLIVSPLLALMRNQIEAAKRLGLAALSINSTNVKDWPSYHDAIRANEVDSLLVSPERLANDSFVQNVLIPIAGDIGMLVVDEAHCISDWGHDFRPDYRRLVSVLQRLPSGLPLLATTATANDRVVNDVVAQLGKIVVQRGPLMRDSLNLATLKLPDQSARLAWLAEHVPSLPGTGIIYVLTKRDANLVANWLNENGIAAAAYYSGVRADGFENGDSYRQHLEDRLLNNQLKALVATTALGMGYDKPDLGFVVHYQAAGSVVAYYQQVGRAGRAIEKAYGVLMSGREDDDIHEYFRRTAFPPEEEILSILHVVQESDGLSIREIEAGVNLGHAQIEKVLKFLSVENPAPVLKQGNQWTRTPVPFVMDRDRVKRLTRQREVEWQEVVDYVESQTCLMRHLAACLDDKFATDCGRCSVCVGKSIVEETIDPDILNAAQRRMRVSEIPFFGKIQVPNGAFSVHGWKSRLPDAIRPNEGRVLSQWNDAGWGRLVADGKQRDRDFSDDLVEAVADMILKRWQPSPVPAWATCVPSNRMPHLVPDFARSVAKALQIPFLNAVKKIVDNHPQKLQENSFYQCRNLDGVFEIELDIPNTPVLLIDDIVDSGWTMTVVSALLLEGGSGPVWPVALASTGPGA